MSAPAKRLLFLAAALAVLVAANIFWLSWDTVPPGRGAAGYLLALMNGSSVGVYWSPSAAACLMGNLLLTTMLLASVFGIARRLHGETAGFVAAFLALAYPFVFGLTRTFLPDLAGISLTAAACYFLIASEEFRGRLDTVLFGVLCGLGLIVQPGFALFAAIPVAVTAARVVRRAMKPGEERAEAIRSLAWLAVAMLVAAASAAALGGWKLFDAYFPAAADALTNNQPHPWLDPRTLIVCLKILVRHQIGIPFFALLVYGLIVLGRSVARKDAVLLGSWAIGLYVVLTLLPHKSESLTAGLLVPSAIISGVAVASLARYRKAVMAVVVAFALAQFAAFTLPGGDGCFRWAGDYSIARSPRQEDWKVEEALRTIDRPGAKVALLCDHTIINPQTFECVARGLGLKLRWAPLDDARENMASCDFVAVKSGWRAPAGPGSFRMDDALQRFEDGRANFSLLRTLALPDGSSLLLYRNLLPREGALAHSAAPIMVNEGKCAEERTSRKAQRKAWVCTS